MNMINNTKLKVALILPIIILFLNGITHAQNNTSLQDSIIKKTQAETIIPNLIKSKDFNKGLIISPYELIQGKIPGLRISSYDGSPNGHYIIKKVGNYKVDGNVSPIIIIDGIQQFSNSIEINPLDIESIKYEACPSLDYLCFGPYANGAFIIETKRITKTLNIEFSSTYALSKLTKKVNVFNTRELAEIRKRKFPSDDSFNNYATDINTDWQDAIYRSATGKNNYIAASGIISKWLPFRASIGHLSQEGIIMTSKYEMTSYNLRLNPSFIDNHLNFDLNMRIKDTDERVIDNDILESAIRAEPSFEKLDTRTGFFNPYLFLRDSKNNSSRHIRSLNAVIDYRLQSIKEMNINLIYSNNTNTLKNKNRYNREAYWFNDISNMREIDNEFESDESFIKASINYSKEFKNDNKFDFSLAYQKYNIDFSSNYLMTGAFEYKDNRIENNKTKSKIDQSYKLATLSYSYQGKFISTLNYVIMDDSRNKTNHYSTTNLSFMWNMKREAFLIEKNNLSALSIKVNYRNITSPNFMITGKKDKLQTYHIGIYYGLFNERISGSLSFNNNNSKRLIPYPTTLSISQGILMGSTTEMNSKTLLFTLNTRIIDTNNIKWNLSTNISYSNNEITDLYRSISSGRLITMEGESINTFNLYRQNYNYKNNPIEGDYKGDDNRAKEKEASESYDPKCIIGLYSSLKINNWDLSCSGRAHTGNYIYNALAADSYYDSALQGNISKYVLDSDFNKSNSSSDYYISSGAFFRMDYISLAYNFNKLFKKRVNINLAATVQNAFIITSYDGEDPERSNGIDEIRFPRPRIYSLSLKLTFK